MEPHRRKRLNLEAAHRNTSPLRTSQPIGAGVVRVVRIKHQFQTFDGAAEIHLAHADGMHRAAVRTIKVQR